MRQVTGMAVLVLVAAVGCGASKGGADAGSGAGGAAGASGAGGAGTGGASAGRGGTGGSSAGNGGAGTGGGSAGRGGASGSGGSGGNGDAGTGGSSAGRGGASGSGGSGGNGGAGGTDAGCSGSAGFICLIGGCRSDVGMLPVCSNGAWSCPSNTTDSRGCGGCIGNPPPNYVCTDGGWFPVTDAGVGGG